MSGLSHPCIRNSLSTLAGVMTRGGSSVYEQRSHTANQRYNSSPCCKLPVPPLSGLNKNVSHRVDLLHLIFPQVTTFYHDIVFHTFPITFAADYSVTSSCCYWFLAYLISQWWFNVKNVVINSLPIVFNNTGWTKQFL